MWLISFLYSFPFSLPCSGLKPLNTSALAFPFQKNRQGLEKAPSTPCPWGPDGLLKTSGCQTLLSLGSYPMCTQSSTGFSYKLVLPMPLFFCTPLLLPRWMDVSSGSSFPGFHICAFAQLVQQRERLSPGLLFVVSTTLHHCLQDAPAAAPASPPSHLLFLRPLFLSPGKRGCYQAEGEQTNQCST